MLGETLEGGIGNATFFWNMDKPAVLGNAEAVSRHYLWERFLYSMHYITSNVHQGDGHLLG